MKKYFSDIHALPSSQLGDEKDLTIDDENTILALNAVDSKRSYENLFQLANCYVKQLRYKRALETINEVLEIKPNDLKALRVRAIRHLTTLQVAKALDDFTYLDNNGFSEDLSYQLGLSYFYLSRYEEALVYFEKCFTLSTDEMKVACIYWHTIAAWRCGRSPSLLKEFKIGMDIGHHVGYDAALKLYTGVLSEDVYLMLLAEEPSDLEYSIFSYGYYAYLEKEKRSAEKDSVLNDILSRDSFWISFAYIAAYNDKFYSGRGR